MDRSKVKKRTPVKRRMPINQTGAKTKAPLRRNPPVKRQNAPRPAEGARRTPYLQAYRRSRAINRSATMVAGIFFVFVLIYLVRSFYAFLVTPHIPTEVIKLGTIETPRIVSGIIVRDEYVYTANREGRVTFSLSDYDRVRPGVTVCSIQDVEAVEDINRDMSSIEEQIIALQQMREDISSVDPAVQRINAQIKNIVDSHLHFFTSLTVSEVYAFKESVSQSVNIRNQMIIDDNKNIKEDLNRQQQQLLTRLNSHLDIITAEQSGIMSPIIDGLEETLTFENMQELTREQTQVKVDYDKIIPKKEVKAEDPVFKIIASNEWYIAAYMPNDMIEGYEENDIRILYLEKNGEYVPVTTRVSRIDPGYRESFLLFKCTKNLIDYINTRSVNIKTAENVRKGYKISNTAITQRTVLVIPTAFVYETESVSQVIKRTETGEDIIPVSIYERDEDHVYILVGTGGLSLGDTLVRTAPSMETLTLTETLEVQGVYKVNNGFAEFKRIVLDADSTQSNGFTIMDPALNQNIKVYDNIVSDASGVTDRQIIR